MTELLFRMLSERFPPLNRERITSYGAMERIYADLVDPLFANSLLFDCRRTVRDIAGRIFDVPFSCDSRGDVGFGVFFWPNTPDSYSQGYANHYIAVQTPSRHPVITLSTHNRGAGILLERQRSKYFRFVDEIFDAFVLRVRMG